MIRDLASPLLIGWLCCAAGCLAGIPTSSARAENWPGFRGPTGMGITRETELPLHWSAGDGTNILWKSPLPATTLAAKPDNTVKPDHNQSIPIIWQDRVFVTTAYWPEDRKQEEQPEQPKQPEQRLTCYRLSDGRQLWDAPIPPGPWKLRARASGTVPFVRFGLEDGLGVRSVHLLSSNKTIRLLCGIVQAGVF